MTKKLMIEFIPLTLFLVSGIGYFFKFPHAALLTAVSGAFIGMLYFYASFWLFAEVALSSVIKIIAGIVYSISIIACTFSFLKWPNWPMFTFISCVGLIAVSGICLINYKLRANRPLLYRGVLFMLIVVLVYVTRIFQA